MNGVFGRVGIFPVPAARGSALVRLLLPLDLAGRRIERVDHVADVIGLFRRLVVARAHATHHFLARQALALELGDVLVAVSPGVGCLNGLLLMPAVRNTVSPQTIGDDHPCRHRHLPAPVLGRRPLPRHRVPGRDTAHVVPTESWPGFLRLGVRCRDRHRDEQCDEQQKDCAFHAFENTSDPTWAESVGSSPLVTVHDLSQEIRRAGAISVVFLLTSWTPSETG